MSTLDVHNAPSVRDKQEPLRTRLIDRDPFLWSEDAKVAEAILNRLGWLDAVGFSRSHLEEITEFARSIRAEDFQHVVLLGMGGSSLAPEVLGSCFGSAPGYPELTVLDSTAPDAVRAVARRCHPADTLYLVSSKSGTTAETLAFYDYFRALVEQQAGGPAGRHFAAITDPGSALAVQADAQSFRALFLNPADIGGRFSALSYFGLVPAALIGIDVDRLLDSADAMSSDAAEAGLAVGLGIVLGELAKAGRNKMTLVPTRGLAPLGAWIEQLVAESTGKQGGGIVPVDQEPASAPEEYGGDRVFVGMDLGSRKDRALSVQLDALAVRGHPVLRWRIPDLHDLGGEFMRWEIATAAAGATLGVNPFDEPDVNESKTRTHAILNSGLQGETVGSEWAVTAYSRQIENLCAQVRPGDYLAVLAFIPPSARVTGRLQALRAELLRRTDAATCLCFGPRYLHSSGQLHKGGANQGVFLMLTAEPGEDKDVPGAGYSFQQLLMAQALGDLAVLRERGRRVLHIHLKNTADSVEALVASLVT